MYLLNLLSLSSKVAQLTNVEYLNNFTYLDSKGIRSNWIEA